MDSAGGRLALLLLEVGVGGWDWDWVDCRKGGKGGKGLDRMGLGLDWVVLSGWCLVFGVWDGDRRIGG